MITISNLYLGHVGFNCDFESQNLKDRQREREREKCYIYVYYLQSWWQINEIEVWIFGRKPKYLGRGTYLSDNLTSTFPHGLVADFKRYNERQISFHDVGVIYTNLRSKIY